MFITDPFTTDNLRNGSVMNEVWWTWSVMNAVCYERGLLWTGLLRTSSVTNAVCYELVCYEQVCYEHGLLSGLLWTGLFWTDTVLLISLNSFLIFGLCDLSITSSLTVKQIKSSNRWYAAKPPGGTSSQMG